MMRTAGEFCETTTPVSTDLARPLRLADARRYLPRALEPVKLLSSSSTTPFYAKDRPTRGQRIRIARKSLTFVPVGPVTWKSPMVENAV